MPDREVCNRAGLLQFKAISVSQSDVVKLNISYTPLQSHCTEIQSEQK